MGFIAELKDVRKSFGNIVALDGVNLRIQQGNVFGLIGPNGAGKTTSVRIFLGLLKPDSGTVRVFGDSVSDPLSHRKRRIGVVLESPGLYLDLSVEQNIAFYAKLYGINDWRKPMQSALQFMGLWERRADPTRKLSKGMKQKAALARALVLDPELLILDEPTSGIDPLFQSDLRQKILDLAYSGKTVFLCSHNMAEVEELCQSVAIINRGHIVTEGSIEDVIKSFENRCFRIRIGSKLEEFKNDKIDFPSIDVLKRTSVQNEFRVMINPEYGINDLLEDLAKRNFVDVVARPHGVGVADIVEALLAKDGVG